MQANFAKLLGTPYTRLPEELLDAFNHDPAAVAGNTRRLKGWRAVEDIHRRVYRQRETLQSFLGSVTDDITVHPSPQGMFGEGMARLAATLTQLEMDRERIAARSKEVAKELGVVKVLQSDVKTRYNETLSQVSTIYPEVHLTFYHLWQI